MHKAIIFDIDNTLIDFVDTKNAVIAESVKAMVDAGIAQDVEHLQEKFSQFYWKVGIEDQKIFQKFLSQEFGTIEYRVLAHAIIAYRKAKNGLLRPYPGTKRTLIALKAMGLQLAILSDAPKLEAYIRLCQVGIDDFFDLIVTIDDTHALKPAAKGFQLLTQKLQVLPADCIMIGDMPHKDVLGAKRLGMTTIFAAYGHKKPVQRHGADFVVHNVLEIVDVVQNLNKI